MKNIFNLIISLFLITSCKAQITTLVNLDEGVSWEAGKYYKDINNNLNIYVGTYLYVNGNTSLEIVLQKKIASNRNNVFTEDILVGGYRYIENGIEKINTLNTLTTGYSDGRYYSLNGNLITTGNLACPECGVNEKWISATIKDPVAGRVHDIYIRRNFPQSSGLEQMKVYIGIPVSAGAVEEGTPPRPTPLLPMGQWITLIKQ